CHRGSRYCRRRRRSASRLPRARYGGSDAAPTSRRAAPGAAYRGARRRTGIYLVRQRYACGNRTRRQARRNSTASTAAALLMRSSLLHPIKRTKFPVRWLTAMLLESGPLRVRFPGLSLVELVELLRAALGNRQGVPPLPGVYPGDLNDLADVVAGMPQRAFK